MSTKNQLLCQNQIFLEGIPQQKMPNINNPRNEQLLHTDIIFSHNFHKFFFHQK